MSDGDGVLVTRIVIERRMDGNGHLAVHAHFAEADGAVPGIVELVGMLEITKDIALRLTTDTNGGAR